MEPAGAGHILITERMLGTKEPQSAYRLALPAEQIDYRYFANLVNRAASVGPATTVALCTQALKLWRGRPLADVNGEDFATPLVQRLEMLRLTALRELIRAHAELGRPDLALPFADQLAALLPADPDAARTIQALREEVRGLYPHDLLRREFPGLRVTVVVRCGDIFEQDDANLVVGFGDTFDTATQDDAVISRDSVQGQLLDRLYGGDRKRLDADLRRGLRGVTAIRVETAQDKPRGKRIRYPVGTVAPLALDGRRVFAFTRPGDEDGQAFARSLGAEWAGSSEEASPEQLDGAIVFAAAGSLMPAALRVSAKGARVISAGIHMSDIPSFPYEILWGERSLGSVANLTRRDGEEFLDLAPRVPVRTEVTAYPLADANRALEDVRSGALRGAAVLTVEPTSL